MGKPHGPKTDKSRARALKKSRLIVRNLSFKCSEEELTAAFSKYGEVVEVNIPLKPGTDRRIGCAFVQFKNVFDTEKALRGLSGQPIKGRPVSVDWVMQKEKFLELNPKAAKKAEEEDGDDDDDQEDEDDDGAEEMDDDDDEDEDMDDDDMDGEGSSEGEEGTEDEDEDDSDDDDDDDDDEPGRKRKKKKQDNRPKQKWEGDANEGRTLFVRNVSFESEPEALREGFSRFGEVHYARILTDYETERSRGMAFIQFKTKEGAEACMQAVNNQENITVDGREMNVNVAVTRENTTQFKAKTPSEERKEKTDSRNLYLAREGVILSNSDAAKELSKTDLAKRRKAEMEKKVKLANPNFFVSPTRLCVRNIPRAVTDEELRTVFTTCCGKGKPLRVQKARIMRDLGNVNAQGVARPRGFGFVEFSSHDDALEALRSTNNNPDTFGKDKRLIVEFSIEDQRALHKQELRRQKAAGDKFAARRGGQRGGQPGRFAVRNQATSGTSSGNTPAEATGEAPDKKTRQRKPRMNNQKAKKPAAEGGQHQQRDQQRHNPAAARNSGRPGQAAPPAAKGVKPPKTSRRQKQDKEEVALEARIKKHRLNLQGGIQKQQSKWFE